MLHIPRPFEVEMIAHAQEEDPNECCGILSGSDDKVSKLYRITNVKRSPVRYLMDPQEQLNAMLDSERNNREVLAFYHSHTHGPAYPSITDVRMAQQSGWLDVYYVLVSLEDKSDPHVRAFHIKVSGEIAEEELRIV